VLSTAAYIEEEMGLHPLDKEMIRATNFTLKQIMPCTTILRPVLRGIDHDMVTTACLAGASSRKGP
jgi:pyruvate carboxylase